MGSRAVQLFTEVEEQGDAIITSIDKVILNGKAYDSSSNEYVRQGPGEVGISFTGSYFSVTPQSFPCCCVPFSFDGTEILHAGLMKDYAILTAGGVMLPGDLAYYETFKRSNGLRQAGHPSGTYFYVLYNMSSDSVYLGKQRDSPSFHFNAESLI